jgi:hypothetical protein
VLLLLLLLLLSAPETARQEPSWAPVTALPEQSPAPVTAPPSELRSSAAQSAPMVTQWPPTSAETSASLQPYR